MALPPIMGERPDMTPFAAGGADEEDDEDEGGEPAAKRRRLDEGTLQPEEAFLASAPAEVKIIVQVLAGEARGAQTLTVDVPYRTRVGELKGKLQGMGCTIPATRMRIVHQDQRYLLKDSNSLAFYNLPTGTVLEARMQERGGKKK
jgi:splicing factor 3A subunit 1